jgi:Fe-S cluster assembly iron-binding protein IscA
MIEMTPAAADVIRGLLTDSGTTHDAGLRFRLQNDDSVRASVVDGPEEGDQVVPNDKGGQLFLDPEAAKYLDDKVLDVLVANEGEVSFAIASKQ